MPQLMSRKLLAMPFLALVLQSKLICCHLDPNTVADDLAANRLSDVARMNAEFRRLNKNMSASWWQPQENVVRQTLSLSAEHRLYKYLFDNGRYRRMVRPKMNHNERLFIQLGICIMSIDEILENQDPMVTSGCVKLKWTDEYLRWNPLKYGNLTTLVLPSSEIWLPDIALINSAEPYITNRTSFVEVNYLGSVGFYPSGRFSTKCKISLTFFPFDRQVCEMQFESWTYPIEWIELVLWPVEPIDVKDFYRNHQWDLDRVDAVSGKAFYDGFEFSTMRFVFHVRRRTLHYITLYIFPCTLISVMQVLSHSLPVEHPARVTLLTGIFVAQSVIQSSLTSQTPKSSDGISLTQLYIEIFTGCMLFSMVVTFMNMHVWFRVSSSPLLANCTFPSLGVLLKSFFFWDIRSHPDHFHYNFYEQSQLSLSPPSEASSSSRPRRPTSLFKVDEDEELSIKEDMTVVSAHETLARPGARVPMTSQKKFSERMRRFLTELREQQQKQEADNTGDMPPPTPPSESKAKAMRRNSSQEVRKRRHHRRHHHSHYQRFHPRTRRQSSICSATVASSDQTEDYYSRYNLHYVPFVTPEYGATMASMGAAPTASLAFLEPLSPMVRSPSTGSSMSSLSGTSRTSSNISAAIAKRAHKESWIRFCLLLDKICMYIFFFTGVLSPLCIFIVVPHTYNQYLQSFDADAHNSTNYFYESENIKVHYFHEFE